MPNYGVSFAGGSAPALDVYAAGVNYTQPQGTWATQAGGDIGGQISSESGLPYNSNLESWNRPAGYWNNSDYLSATRGIGNPGSRYLPPSSGGTAGVNPNGGTVPVPGSPGRYINPNDPSQRYQPVSIPKSPDVNAGEATLMDEFQKGAASSLQGFDSYLSTFKNALNDAFNQTKTANNPTGTINRMNANQAQYEAGLNQAAGNYANLNASTAAKEQGIVQQATDLLPSYNAAADAAANIAMQQVQKQVNRYKAGGGAPTGLSSSELQQLQAGDANILVPLEQAKIQQAYNVLQQYSLPTTIDIANRETNRIATFTPQVLSQIFQSGQATTQAIQALQQQTAQMSMQDATAYMQALGVPEQVRQQILSGQISQLGALNTLEDQSNYRGLQDLLGANPTQPQYFSPSTGAYPTTNRYTGTAGSYNPALGTAGASTATGAQPTPPPTGAVGSYVWDGNNRRWQNWQTGQAMPQGFNPLEADNSNEQPAGTVNTADSSIYQPIPST